MVLPTCWIPRAALYFLEPSFPKSEVLRSNIFYSWTANLKGWSLLSMMKADYFKESSKAGISIFLAEANFSSNMSKYFFGKIYNWSNTLQGISQTSYIISCVWYICQHHNSSDHEFNILDLLQELVLIFLQIFVSGTNIYNFLS